MNHPTALIADDEPLLREHLRAQLARLWPELDIVAEARNGGEAVELFDQHHPAIVFLDVHMPGLNGIEAARALARRSQIVFITAYEQYAVQAFEQGAIDYLVKPIDAARLADTVRRLQERLGRSPDAGAAFDAVLERMASELRQRSGTRNWLQWIKASVGSRVRLIAVEQVAFIRAEGKYTSVVWDDGEALIRKSIRELGDELDPDRFVQIHRSVIVNLHYVSEVVRGVNETADVHLRGRTEVLPVSRSYLHHFRQM
ncbi:LytR/AlgR family response regulator transcription factor [Massilia pseudoviolaceinigra]|uniref:LytR/AlgR family response regulator transcription factor n=1 Tax=Massilia pseudoviolaceinigra TaxID=3057165 RepID=UPI002796A0F7|nr:LytTR family DNA-binding domain-containing protein [Massilia sp. CCM 9206]MDQ1924115.1 LytTR family DNA-binding domain-containing protein [Massilia sp. CCM 9206]